VSRLCNHARAARHSRSFVAGEMSRTCAVSSSDSPRKYRNSTTRALRASNVALVDQAEKRLIDEGSRLQGMVRPLLPQIGGRATPQLLVHEKHETVAGVRIPSPPGAQQRRHVGRRLGSVPVVHLPSILPLERGTHHPADDEVFRIPRVIDRSAPESRSRAPALESDASWPLVRWLEMRRSGGSRPCALDTQAGVSKFETDAAPHDRDRTCRAPTSPTTMSGRQRGREYSIRGSPR
jgi:hypothetical protein